MPTNTSSVSSIDVAGGSGQLAGASVKVTFPRYCYPALCTVSGARLAASRYGPSAHGMSGRRPLAAYLALD